jgi:broad specificity phosphatase PhoE
MTTFYLIRHGSNDYFTHTIVGRALGIHLNDAGRSEAGQLAKGLANEGIQKIFSSPLERCRETAEPLSKKLSVEVQIADALLEVDFGDWTDKKFAELEPTEHWKRWNYFRGGVRAPNGETMIEVQSRVVGFIQKLHDQFPNERIALFSHGDPLRAALIHFLGAPTELIRRIEISPAGVSVLTMDGWNAQIRALNRRFGEQPLAQ